MKDPRDQGRQVQHDPYGSLLTESEKQFARNVPFRFLFNAAAIGTAAVYYLTRHNELHRIRTFSISADLIFGLGWRFVLAGVIADQMSRRLFVNYDKLRQHKMAENEVRKIMVKYPNAKTLKAPYQKANSYYWV